MKKLLILLTLGCLLGCMSTPIQNRPPDPIQSHLDQVTVALVHNKLDGDVRTYCSGVFVGEDLILTAFHCVKGEAEMLADEQDEEFDDELDLTGLPMHYVIHDEAKAFDENPGTVRLGKVSQVDSDHDIALIQVEHFEHQVAELVNESPGVGEQIFIVGHPIGLSWTHVTGIVAAYRGDMFNMKGSWMQVSSPVYFGNSGGGVFDRWGRLCGIASFIVRAPNTAFFVHAESIRQLMLK